MKDIDFDELDKAVNSLMATGGPADITPDTPEPPETIVTIPSTTPAVAPTSASIQPPVSQEPAAVVNAAPATSASSPVPPAVRRGRFMDMVQTQSSPNRSAPRPAASREGLSVTPRIDTAVVAQSAEQIAPTEPAVVPVAPEPISTREPESTASFDTMPDPIDTVQVDSDATPSDAISPELDTQAAASLESPFLADAKVEKRPLNSNLGLELEEAAKEETDGVSVAPPIESSKNIDTDADEPPIYPTAPELSGDLVAIESGQAVETTQAIDTVEAASQVDAPSAPLGATSIAQQYKAKESSGDQSHAAIYDAAQYPEPLSHPAKSKSGWLWVLWVTVLLGIGAGGAVLLYVLGIIP